MNKTRRIARPLALLLALCLMLAWFPARAMAKEITPASGTCGENLTWTLDGEGTLTISGTGDMTDVSYSGIPCSGVPWYSYASDITSVVIEDGVTSIGDFAFCGCADLISAEIPNSVTSIGKGAFWYCTSLESIVLPEGLPGIEKWAFANCASMKSVTLPDGITYIGDSAFFCCRNLSNINIPDSVIHIDFCAFTDCPFMQVGDEGLVIVDGWVLGSDGTNSCVNIPVGVKGIGGGAFSYSGMESLTLPEGLVTIGQYAFENCANLSSIEIPNSVTYIDKNAFAYCSEIQTIYFEGDAPIIDSNVFCDVTAIAYYPPENGTWTADVMQDYGGTITWVSYGSDVEKESELSGTCGENLTWTLDENGTLTISGVGDMDDYDESWEAPWIDVKSVVINNGVTSIGVYAFGYCDNLTSITIPASVTSIGGCAFLNCKGLTSVVIPEGVTSIGNMVFGYCDNLTNITIPASMTSIGGCAFWGCSGLSSLVIPDGVISIGTYAFNGCENLTIYGSVGSFAEAYAKENEIPFAELVNYEIIEGINGEWTSDSGEELTFRVSGALEDFVSVSVDGTLVDPANYTVKSGSTIITFAEDYLKALSVGEHTLTVTFTDGMAMTAFTVNAASEEPSNPTDTETPTQPDEQPPEQPSEPATEPDEVSAADETTTEPATPSDNPKTGDNTAVLCLAMLLVSGLGIMAIVVYRRKLI